VRQTIIAGGDNCSRVLFIGACLGAINGPEGVPQDWQIKTKEYFFSGPRACHPPLLSSGDLYSIMTDSNDASPLVVTPKEGLFFPPPLDRPIENIIQVKNDSTKAVTFKIKTTAPQCYHVKPRMKVLVANETCNVRVTYRPQAGQVETTPQHKFQIECRPLTEDELKKLPHVAPETLWTAPSPSISRVRINCSFCPQDQIPSGIHPTFPLPDDARSEMSYAPDTVAPPEAHHPTAGVLRSAPGSMSLGAVQLEVQVLRQSLATTEAALRAKAAEVDVLKAEHEGTLQTVRSGGGGGGGGGFRRFVKRLFYLGLMLAVGYAGRQSRKPAGCPPCE
jgi:hypothetical protein